MAQVLKKHPVNWQGGMKVSKEHFIATEDFLMDQIRDRTLLSTESFGLLPAIDDTSSNLEYHLETDTAGFSVLLTTCRAITPNGLRVEVIDLAEPLVGHCDMLKDALYNIYIGVNMAERTPFGAPDPEEEPPRLPFVRPGYRISITHESASPGLGASSFVQIGQAHILEGQVKQVDSYIPPCFNINASKQLKNMFLKALERLARIEQNTITLVRNAERIFLEKSADETLAYNVYDFAKNVLNFLANNLDDFRLISPTKSPIYYTIFFVKFARLLRTFFAALQDVERGKTVEYIFKFAANIEAPNQIADLLTSLTKTTYHHHEMYQHLQVVERFLQIWDKIFHDLSQHDFVGPVKTIST